MLDPLPARGRTAGRPRFQYRHSLAAHVIGLFAVNGEGRSGGGEAAEASVGKPDLGEPVVSDVWGRPTGDAWNADPDAHRSAQVGTLLLPGGCNRLATALGVGAATVDAVRINLLGPRIGVPCEVVDAHKTMLGSGQGKIASHLLKKERATGFLRRAR